MFASRMPLQSLVDPCRQTSWFTEPHGPEPTQVPVQAYASVSLAQLNPLPPSVQDSPRSVQAFAAVVHVGKHIPPVSAPVQHGFCAVGA